MKYRHLITMASIVFASPAIASSLVVPGPGTGNAQAPTPFNYYGSSGSRFSKYTRPASSPARSSSAASASGPIRAPRRAFSSATPSIFPTSSSSYRRQAREPMKAARYRAPRSPTISAAMRPRFIRARSLLRPRPPELALSHSTIPSVSRSPCRSGPRQFAAQFSTLSRTRHLLVRSGPRQFAARCDDTLGRDGPRLGLWISYI